MTELEVLSNRLESVERNYRRIRSGVLIVALMVCAGMVMGQDAPERIVIPGVEIPSPGSPSRPRLPEPEDVVRAREFVLVDGDGRDRASLVTDRAGSVFFVMFDNGGKVRASMSVTPAGPSLTFLDSNGRTRAVMGSTNLVASRIAKAGIVERQPASSIVLFGQDGEILSRTP